MTEKAIQLGILSLHKHSAIEEWCLGIQLAFTYMVPTSTYVADSNEEQPDKHSQCKSNSTQPKGSTQKHPRSKSPSSKQTKHQKTDTRNDVKEQKKPLTSTKKSKTNAALTLEEQSAKNATSCMSTIEWQQAALLKEELAATIKRVQKSSSPAYSTYKLPKLLKPQQKGAPYYGAGGPPSNYNIWEYVALWITKDGHLFAIIDDHYLHKLMPCKVVKLLPHCTTIVKDVATLYRMTQKTIKAMLVVHDIVSIFHIALDLYQLANGHNYLGIVLFHPAVKDNVLNIERFMLECLSFSGKHTGAALANVVYQVLVNFGIQDRVLGVVCNNASNNANMMNQFKKFNMKHLVGPTVRVHCVPHILNLTSKAIAAPFIKKRAKVEQDPNAAKEAEKDQPFFGGLLDDKEVDPDHDEASSVDEDFDPNTEDETGEDDGCPNVGRGVRTRLAPTAYIPVLSLLAGYHAVQVAL
ncbi:hypothetical protein B0J17DRAFT_718656 [Rhizoctonia solani]|nr:hypothetical protein B0J17DRAFT_718656 [Rhizoctonia solani]